MGVSLPTQRLLLKTLSATDAKKILDYLQKNRIFFQEWSPKRENCFYTLRFQKSILRSEAQLLRERKHLRLWLFKLQEPQSIIGDISLSNIVWGSFCSGFLGYKMAQTEINQGYMLEALRKTIEYAFIEMKLHRIEANIMPHNEKSIYLIEKLGFVCEGLSKKYLKINGIWEDHLHYVCLNTALEEQP
ncbi:MAG: GNAT family N-acetyltransferase [Planctomycetota bacterium]